MKQRLAVRLFAVATILLASNPLFASMNDDPLLYSLKAEEFEWRAADPDNFVAWDIEAWAGYDRDKLWLKSEGAASSDATDDFELQLLYDRAVAPYWDLQVGWRGDFQPERPRNWFALGFQGLAPGFIETEATLFFASGGRAAARLKASYELLLSQQWVLEPKVELNWYAEDDAVNGLGSGLSSLQAGLRLRWQFHPKLAPYLGLNWDKRFGATADSVEMSGGDASELQALVGIWAWF